LGFVQKYNTCGEKTTALEPVLGGF